MPKITINTQSIKNELKSYKDKPANSIIEYIWNGFDAGANKIEIKYKFPKKVSGLNFGYPSLEIHDDGVGWDMNNLKVTNLFLVSPKNFLNYKSLPQGKDGVGRFTFYSFANNATWETVFKKDNFKLTLETDSLHEYKFEKVDSNLNFSKGTRVTFNVNSEKLNQAFLDYELADAIQLEFCWFLKLFPHKSILINNKKIDISDLIKKEKSEQIKIDSNIFDVTLVQWSKKPSREFSKYYFIDHNGNEVFKSTTGLNKKSDNFYHSAYIKSSFFHNFKYKGDPDEDKNEDDNLQLRIPSGDEEEKEKKVVIRKLSSKVTIKLAAIRKPYLRGISNSKVKEWKEDEILPEVDKFGVDQESYEEIIKEVYTVAPQLFTNSSDDQKKIIFRLFSSLLNSNEKDELLKIIDQVYRLPKDDRKKLSELFDKATLSNILKTIQEIENRLHIINVLEEILFHKTKETKEVIHLQKLLDENFWIFGEDYRLFASTEGSMKKTLNRFKDEILRKPSAVIKTKSRKEVDLFLTKCEQTSDKIVSIVVEIKRPSIKLGKDEYDQIMGYMSTILKEPACNGKKMKWIFYLIGNDYNDHILGLIKNARPHGEEREGLVYNDIDKNAKLYVKKWSDILNVEQRSKYKFLQDKLKMESADLDDSDVDEIVEGNTSKK